MPQDPDLHAVHGGDIFRAIGVDFSHLERTRTVVPADVLDAWYGPPTQVMETLREHLDWIVRTSPPTHSEGLRAAVAQARGLDPGQVLVGPGTSTLMFEVLPRLVGKDGTLVVLDPMYGEYAHLGGSVIGCQTRRFELPLGDFRVDIDRLARFAQGASVLALVNPNSPTGIVVGLERVRALADALPGVTLWLDETYIDFFSAETGQNESAEQLVADHPNLVVCKSMSKFYGLSGLRLGYLVADPGRIGEWERFSPPWSIGLAGQIAGVMALQARAHYDRFAVETVMLRKVLAGRLESDLGWATVESNANFLLARVSPGHAAETVERCAAQGVFLRNCDSLSPRFSNDHIRVSVRPKAEIDLIVEAAAGP